MSAERLVAPSAAMEKLWAWAERTETGDRAELDVHAARRRLGSARRRRRRLRGRVLLALRRLPFLQAPRCRALRRHRRRQPRAVLPRPRGRRQAAAGLRRRDSRRSAPVREVRDRRADRDALGRRRRAHDAQAAPHLHGARVATMRRSTKAMRRLQMVLARVPGERYPVAANDERARTAAGDFANRSTGSRTGSTATG